MEQRRLLGALVPPLDTVLATQLVDEFVSMERRFIQRDWEPAALDGGQFAEILARVLYHQDSGTLNLKKDFGECCAWMEDQKGQYTHLLPRRDVLHLVRVVRTIWKFRSERGAVHISPSYAPNHMDSKYLIEAVRWAFNETLRLFWNGDREDVARAIRELLQFDVPCVGAFESVLLVQRTDLTVDEEVLVLLHYAGEQGFTRTELGKYVKAAASSITEALQRLSGAASRRIVTLPSGRFRLTDLGSKHIRENLAQKLLLH